MIRPFRFSTRHNPIKFRILRDGKKRKHTHTEEDQLQEEIWRKDTFHISCPVTRSHLASVSSVVLLGGPEQDSG